MSGQVAVAVGFLTRDPSLILNTDSTVLSFMQNRYNIICITKSNILTYQNLFVRRYTSAVQVGLCVETNTTA